jgi:hypothetical protein
MTINEFILLDKAKVRRDSNLMSLYLDFFKTAFGRVPNCAGCSFGTDWQKLVSLYSIKGEKKVTLQKGKIMNRISIKKIQGKILTYRKDGKTYRQYDNILTDEFIKEFIVSGTEEENKERVKMFNFPVSIDEEKVVSEIQDSILNTVNEVIKETDKVFSEAINTHSQPKKRGPKKRK